MDEQELRAIVREAVERHLRQPAGSMPRGAFAEMPSRPSMAVDTPRYGDAHASHLILKITAGSDVDDGQCVIEPSVRCNHCKFCQSYGH